MNKMILQKAENYMRHCRPGDWQHALRVYKWINTLGRGREDLETLQLVALIHDIGWYGVLKDNSSKISKQQLKELEPIANNNTKPMVIEFLEEINNTKFETSTILRLINTADKHKSSNEDEAIIVDADNLSKLDIDHLKDKYLRDDWLKMYELWEETFEERIKTAEGKRIYPELLANLNQSITEYV